MKAVEILAFGGPEGLAVIDLPDPSPADGQVLIATVLAHQKMDAGEVFGRIVSVPPSSRR